MKLNKKTSIPLLFTLAGTILCNTIPASAYQPIEVNIPFTFKNFESEDAKNYSLTISEKGSSKVSVITYNIANPNTQYYALSFREPGSYSYIITYNAFDKKETYDVGIEIYTKSDNTLMSGLFITKKENGVLKKTQLEFEEEDETPPTPSEKPSDKPSVKPSDNPSVKPSENPSTKPSETPSMTPSYGPSVKPSENPSKNPSTNPSENPSVKPSENPSIIPSEIPSETPSEIPSDIPSETPSMKPSVLPSITSSGTPSNVVIITPSTPVNNPSNGVQTGDNYLPILTIGGIGTGFLALSVHLFKRKK